ncbi:cytochrome b2 (L-lactate ferricytochrome C oxidoreductase) protein [Ceratobasidium sp. AG-Ba]|nr:cytochrome b2 (L-lactate ferricytochrome C oxidoreductase) protein [Ceratobasidium sp. AG-Ba]
MRFQSILALSAPLLALAAPMKYPRAASANDITVLKFAHVLEQLETEFYKQALAKFQPSDFTSAGFVSASVPVEQFTSIATDEATHTSVLASVLQSLGQTPVTGCKFDFSSALTDVKTMAPIARLVENVGVSAYLGGAASSTITVLNMLNGGVAIPSAFDVALSPSQVLALAGGFISGCDLGIPGDQPGSQGDNTGAVAPGTSLTFDSPALAGLDRSTLSCQMMTGGAAAAAVFPIDSCVVPQGIEGPNQNVAQIVAGPTGAFIDTKAESASALFKSGGQVSPAGSNTVNTISPAEASQIAAGGQGAAPTAPGASTDSAAAVSSTGTASAPGATPSSSAAPTPQQSNSGTGGPAVVVGMSMRHLPESRDMVV